MACGVRGAPLWSVVACGCGVRRRVAAAKASARQGQRGHEPGRLLSLAATLMLIIGISFYLYEVGSARAPKGFPWWTAGMKIDPRVPNTLIRKDYSLVNFTNIFPVSTHLSKPQKHYSLQSVVIDLLGNYHFGSFS